MLFVVLRVRGLVVGVLCGLRLLGECGAFGLGRLVCWGVLGGLLQTVQCRPRVARNSQI